MQRGSAALSLLLRMHCVAAPRFYATYRDVALRKSPPSYVTGPVRGRNETFERVGHPLLDPNTQTSKKTFAVIATP